MSQPASPLPRGVSVASTVMDDATAGRTEASSKRQRKPPRAGVSFYEELPSAGSGVLLVEPSGASTSSVQLGAKSGASSGDARSQRRSKVSASLVAQQALQGAVRADGPTNSDLEAEAAEHAVNYHRVRRKVQEDIRKALLQNPVIRNQLTGPRVMRRDAMDFLAAPTDSRGAPVKGFGDDTTFDWIAVKTGEVSKQREAKEARDAELKAFKEGQMRELELYRQRLARGKSEVRAQWQWQSEQQAVRSECATRVVNTKGRLEVQQHAADYKARVERARKKREGGGFSTR